MHTHDWKRLAVLFLLCIGLCSCTSTPDPQTSADSDPAPDYAVTITEADDGADSEDPVLPGTSAYPEPTRQETTVTAPLAPAVAEAFADALDALDSLTHYRFRTSLLFKNEEDGSAVTGSIEMSGAIAGQDRRHLVWTDLDEGNRIELIQIGDEAWILDEEGWELVPSLLADAMWEGMLIYAPWLTWELLLTSDETATYVATETIEGVLVHQYRSSQPSMVGAWSGTLTESEAQLWIAEAGHPVRHKFTATGIDDEGDRFSISWTSELTDVGAEISVEPPEPSL
jgi:hypothetical protein